MINLKLSAQGRLGRAVRIVFAAGIAGTGVVTTVYADDTAQLQGVEITGTRIRRVDTETSNPVLTIDRKTIEASGVSTMGEIIQSMPSMAGAASNPQVNNGGGAGNAGISLRGLGETRTLILIDGVRYMASDVDALPANMVESVEIVTVGASAIYGSDAVGGVVNFHLRKNFKGAEMGAYYGESDRGDGASKTYWTNIGTSLGTKGSATFGLNYNQQDAVSAASRPFSKAPYALYYGQQIVLGSSTTPTGRYSLPYASMAAFDASHGTSYATTCNPKGTGTVRLTRINEGPGKPAPTDFKCYISSGSANDSYNYQTENLDLTPQERLSFFGNADYKILDDVTWYGNAFYTNTKSNSQIAPDPFVASTYGVTASADSYYNPFGYDLGTSSAQNLQLRLTALGDRTYSYDRDDIQLANGFKGTLLDRFQWNTFYSFAREHYVNENFGTLYLPGLQPALGPSFQDTDGSIVCGTAAAPISGCTPVNFFGVPTKAALDTIAPTLIDTLSQDQTIVEGDISGDLFKLWAGTVGASLGYEYQYQRLNFQPDYLTANDLTDAGHESPTKGAFYVNEVYGEFYVPLLKGLPGVKSLDLIVGERFSDYSTFGTTNNGKYALEYRPYNDLLVRATYADIFRSPTISNLYGGSSSGFTTNITDPCAAPSSNPNCPAQGSGAAPTQYPQTNTANPNLKPETGYDTDIGLVFSPSFYKPITLSADLWHYSIKEAISSPNAQQELDLCASTGLYCDSITRDPTTGEVTNIVVKPSNIGRVETSGIDFGLKWALAKTRFGSFTAAIDNTYLIKYTNQSIDGDNSTKQSYAGQFSSSGDGNYARLRSFASLFWNYGDFGAAITNRFISNVNESNPDGAASTYCPSYPGQDTVDLGGGVTVVCTRKVGYADYVDISGSYTYKPLHTQLTLGVNNVGGDDAPLIYTGFNGTTDSNTYNEMGRYLYGKVKVTFK